MCEITQGWAVYFCLFNYYIDSCFLNTSRLPGVGSWSNEYLRLPHRLCPIPMLLRVLSLPMLLWVKSHCFCPVLSNVTLGQITPPLPCPFQCYFGSNHTVSVLSLPLLLWVKSHRLCPVPSNVTLGQSTVSVLCLPMLLWVKPHCLCPVSSNVTLGQITSSPPYPFQCYFGSNHTVSAMSLPLLLWVKSHRLCPMLLRVKSHRLCPVPTTV